METDLEAMDVGLRAEQKEESRTRRSVSAALLLNESPFLSSPLGSGVFPLRRFGVMVDEVHPVVGVHAPL